MGNNWPEFHVIRWPHQKKYITHYLPQRAVHTCLVCPRHYPTRPRVRWLGRGQLVWPHYGVWWAHWLEWWGDGPQVRVQAVPPSLPRRQRLLGNSSEVDNVISGLCLWGRLAFFLCFYRFQIWHLTHVLTTIHGGLCETSTWWIEVDDAANERALDLCVMGFSLFTFFSQKSLWTGDTFYFFVVVTSLHRFCAPLLSSGFLNYNASNCLQETYV